MGSKKTKVLCVSEGASIILPSKDLRHKYSYEIGSIYEIVPNKDIKNKYGEKYWAGWRLDGTFLGIINSEDFIPLG